MDFTKMSFEDFFLFVQKESPSTCLKFVSERLGPSGRPPQPRVVTSGSESGESDMECDGASSSEGASSRSSSGTLTPSLEVEEDGGFTPVQSKSAKRKAAKTPSPTIPQKWTTGSVSSNPPSPTRSSGPGPKRVRVPASPAPVAPAPTAPPSSAPSAPVPSAPSAPAPSAPRKPKPPPL